MLTICVSANQTVSFSFYVVTKLVCTSSLIRFRHKKTCAFGLGKYNFLVQLPSFVLSSLFFTKRLAKITQFCWLKQGANLPQTVVSDLGSPLT